MSTQISDLLKHALSDIENLQEYYASQKEYIHQYVLQNIEKYEYGVWLSLFFQKKVFETDGIILPEIEQKVIDEIITEYHIEDTDDGKLVSYKLNPEMDFTGYEMDPQVARAEFRKKIQHPDTLRESIIIMLIIKYEDAIARVYRYLLELFPQAYLSEKSISYSELLAFESNFEEIKERFINKEIEEFMRLPLSDWYKSFEKKHNVTFCFDNDDFARFKEIYYRRNLIVHNQRIVNEIYKKGVTNSSCELGDKLPINEEYIEQALLLTRKILIKTVWKLRKTSDAINELITYLFEYGYACMKNGEWELAEYIYVLLLEEDQQTDVDKSCEKVNRYIALKNLYGVETIEEEIRNILLIYR